MRGDSGDWEKELESEVWGEVDIGIGRAVSDERARSVFGGERVVDVLEWWLLTQFE